MPRTPRKPEEVEAEKQRILGEALNIIAESGYEGLTMRKLGQRLGIAAKTIYNYFENKDEVYLQVAMMDFDALYGELREGYDSSEDPSERLGAMTKRFLAFGLSRPSHYHLVLSPHVPMYRDFFDSPSEDMAVRGLSGALRLRELIVRVFEEIAESSGDFTKEEIVLHSTRWLAGVHGILSLHNSGILSYLHDRPESALETLADLHLRGFEPEMMKRSGAHSPHRKKLSPKRPRRRKAGRSKPR